MARVDLQDYVKMGKLFETYGALLNEERQKIMSDYFEFNMTLAEIAESKGVSRQAILDAIEKSSQKLQDYEKVLHLVEKNEKLRDSLEKIIETAPQDIKEKINKILKEL